jgi:DNA replication and repair protein RecF
MSLVDLVVEDLRCLQRAELPLLRHNVIYGSNGSGKTSLLEAIFLLGRGRSFRTRNSERLVRHGQAQLTVFGRIDGTLPRTLGLQVNRGAGTLARVNGTNVRSLTELSQAFPVQVIDPGVHKLVEEGAHRRRRWLDWAVFHVEPAFAEVWVAYGRAIKQRNAALRTQLSQAGAWDPEVARLGEIIAECRRRTLERLRPSWQELIASLVGMEIEVQYSRGWSQDSTLAEALIASRARDQARAMTHSGPHRGDILLRVQGKPAREVLSRGQQKLLAVALNLAPVRLLRELGVPPTLLLDDPAAELDGSRLETFIAEISRLQCQLVLTSLHPRLEIFGRPDRVFHVEQGRVGPV